MKKRPSSREAVASQGGHIFWDKRRATVNVVSLLKAAESFSGTPKDFGIVLCALCKAAVLPVTSLAMICV